MPTEAVDVCRKVRNHPLAAAGSGPAIAGKLAAIPGLVATPGCSASHPSAELTLCLANLQKQPDDQTYADPHRDYEKEAHYYAFSRHDGIIAAAFRPR
jgi:hypothetical protein